MAIFDPMIYYAVETVTGFPEVHEGPSLSTIQAMSFTRTFTISVHSLGNTSNGTRQSTFALILAPVYFIVTAQTLHSNPARIMLWNMHVAVKTL